MQMCSVAGRARWVVVVVVVGGWFAEHADEAMTAPLLPAIPRSSIGVSSLDL